MSQKQTVTINGREYDALTGLPVVNGIASYTTRQQLRKTTPSKQSVITEKSIKTDKKATSAQNVHAKIQRSKTLNRKFTKKPQTLTPDTQPLATTQTIKQPTIARPSSQRLDGIKPKSIRTTPHKSTLAPKTVQHTVAPLKKATQTPHAQPVKSTTGIDTPPMAHPAVTRAHQTQAQKKSLPEKQVPAASVIKQAIIQEALDNAPKHHAKQHKRGLSFRQRISGIVCGCAALVLFAGYLTYLNVPNISVRVAAARAGIDASYPSYHPDGYKLNGPVAYSDGQVRMQFAANTGDSNFTINQSRSNWDSSALLENYVKEKSRDEYSISQEKGLTIYNYGSNAAWVSGGILYTIEGDAPLSPDQIRKIATSV